MNTSSCRRRATAGFSLLEMMVALLMLSIVMGSALSVFRSQSRSFRKGGASMDLHQNARFASSTLDRELRTLGSGVADEQPMFVFGSANALVFNANYASDINDGNAVYINPNLPAAAIDGITTATPIVIPGTAIAYPQRNYFWGGATPSRAETLVFFTQPDPSTPNPNDVMLMQQVNNTPAEMVARNLLPFPGRAFFEYRFAQLQANLDTLQVQVPVGQLPIYHNVAQHGSAADRLPANNLADQIRSVRVNFVAWNGISGSDSASRQFSTTIRMPNNGLAQPKTCGDKPRLTGAINVTSPDVGQFELRWVASGDEVQGEKDVLSYNVYRRLVGAPAWQTTYTQAAGQANYDLILPDAANYTPGSTWEFAIAAQDCSPQESDLLVAVPFTLLP